MNAGSSKGASTCSRSDFSQLEVAEEFFPFLVGGDAIFLARAQASAASEKGEVGLDGLVRVDGLVAHGDVDVAVACNDLGDMRWQAANDGIGDKDSPEVVGRVMKRLPISGVFQAGVGKS